MKLRLFINSSLITGRAPPVRSCRRSLSGVSLYEGTKHSTANRLKALGADDRLLAQLMGHRDTRSVEKYAKLDSSAIRAGLERLRKRGRGEE